MIYINCSQIDLDVFHPLIYLHSVLRTGIFYSAVKHTHSPETTPGVESVRSDPFTPYSPLRQCVSPVFRRCAPLTANVPNPIWDKVGGVIFLSHTHTHTQTHCLSLTCTSLLSWLLMWCRSFKAFSHHSCLTAASHSAHTRLLPSISLNKHLNDINRWTVWFFYA